MNIRKIDELVEDKVDCVLDHIKYHKRTWLIALIVLGVVFILGRCSA